MNDSNHWEQQLSGWVPRRPSAKLKRRLFGTATSTPEPLAGVSWRWVAAATALAVLALTGWSQLIISTMPNATSRSAHVLASLSASNGSPPSLSLPDRHSRQNSWSLVKAVGTFEWTNPPGSLSTTSPFLIGMTNSLIR